MSGSSGRKGRRQLVFICGDIIDGEMIMKAIPATSQAEAIQFFTDTHKQAPRQVLGGYYPQRTQVLETTRVLKFSNQTKKAIYNDWVVNAFLLVEPVDQAYLVFLKRVDDKKIPNPKGTITVPISDLRFL
jgi:hypothetical protein